MALPRPRSDSEVRVYCYSPSVGDSPIVAVALAPFRGKLSKVEAVINGTLTADSVCAVTISGVAVSGPLFTITASGSVAGTSASFLPTAANAVVGDQYISITPVSGTGSAITGTFALTFQRV